jgi:hypothetical protein
MPGYPCCEEFPNCGDICVSGAPEQFRIALSGLGTQDCADCGDLNYANYIVDHVVSGAALCQWRYTFEWPYICTAKTLAFELRYSGGNYLGIVNLIDEDGFLMMDWWKNYGASKPSCHTFSNESIPFNSDVTSECTGADPALITAV